MKSESRLALTSGLCLLILCALHCGSPWRKDIASASTAMQTGARPGQRKRPVSISDSIRMTRPGDLSYTGSGSSKGSGAKFSPDEKRFVVVLRKGNLEQNTNEYSLLLFQATNLPHPSSPRLLVSLASSSNRPAIKNVTWLDDSDTILFLGEHPGQRTQLYSVKCSTGVVLRLTNQKMNLSSFTSSAKGDRIVYSAESPVSNLMSASARHNGIPVANQSLSDLIKGSSEHPDHELFVKELGRQGEVRVHVEGGLTFADAKISLSPNGKYFVVQTEARRTPGAWVEYEDKFLRVLLSNQATSGGRIPVYQYELVDTRTGGSRVLLNSPIRPNWGGSEVAWGPDSNSVAVSNVYLPLDIGDPPERAVNKSDTFLVEITIPGRQIFKISDQDLRLIKWDSEKNEIVCEVGRIASLTGKTLPRVNFRKKGGKWEELDAPQQKAVRLPEIALEEDLNTPPRVVVVDPTSGRGSLLIDLNPQFRRLAFGKVEEIKWKDTLDGEVEGGLYWPVNYIPDKEYPLVIQTHGFTPDKFWVDGPYTTAFAAQALAGKGFFVLQVPDPDWHLWDTPEEAPRAMAGYEGAINYLDRRGLIDRHHVGIVGFSRTCFYVTYTLTHSTYDFMAAAVADGADASYFQYMVLANQYPTVASEFDAVNGAPPFGDGLSLWMKRSPEFLMHKVRAALRIQAIGPASLLAQWSWFSGLSRLGKPVDLIYLPDGTHVLEKPWERMVSQQGNVDWFCFWLKGEEDPEPAKIEQYKRWRELRKLHQQHEKNSPAPSPD